MKLALSGVALLLAGGAVVFAVFNSGDHRLSSALTGLGGGNATELAARAVVARCELNESDRAVYREALNAALPADHCSVATCPGDAPAACPRDTVLAETGEPAEVDIDTEVEVDKLRAEVEAQVREDVREEVEAEVAEEAAAEAANPQ